MSFTNTKIKISLNNQIYEIYYSYREETTFQDLLEYFAYLIPSLNVCTCYRFYIFENKNDTLEEAILISENSKIEKFADRLKNLSLINNQGNCRHNQYNFMINSKSSLYKWYKNYFNELQGKLKKYEEYSKNIIPIPKPNYKDYNAMKFYDVIINIESIKDINKGWDIKMSQNGKQNYETYKNEKVLRIGVIGNANKGKSFLLSKISKIDLPSGMTLKTEGLSIKYPSLEVYKDRRMVLLDSAGLETPVLLSDQKIQEEKTELFREKSREKLITELFLQNYIINNSDILIVVVDSLSYSEQKLLMKIKNEIERSKRKYGVKLYIIHNLKTYTSKSQVEDYIKNTLLKSATFTLIKVPIVSTDKTQITRYVYSENKKDDKDSPIFHLIYANENSEAGRYYNQFTLNFIEDSYKFCNNLTNFDAIESVKKRFVEISEYILEKTENKKLTMESFDNTNPIKIRLKDEKEIILKKCLIDELGFSNLKPNGYEPKYNIYEKDNKIIIKVEVPGRFNLEEEVVSSSMYKNIIKLRGVKEKDKEPEKFEDNIFNSREYGQFFLDIPLDYNLKPEKSIITHDKGLVMLQYDLMKTRGVQHFVGE